MSRAFTVACMQMTASHLPYTRNGLKFFTKRGGLTSGDVETICDRAAQKYVARNMGLGVSGSGTPPVVMRVDLMSAYAQHLRDIIKQRVAHPEHYDTPLRGFKVVVNAGNGCGGFFTWDVLEKLGADTTGSLHLEPGGRFPNHMPNPDDATAMSLTRGAVLAQGADLGVVFDTDVDRSGVVDGAGAGAAAINGDRLIALMSAIVLDEHPGTMVVTDARASDGLTRFIESRGGPPLPVPRRLPQRHRQGRAAQRRRRGDAPDDGDHRARRAQGELLPRRRRLHGGKDHH